MARIVRHPRMIRMKRVLYLFLCSTLCCLSAHAQRIIGELESNAGYDGVGVADSMMRDDARNKKAKKVVPVDVRAWTVDPIYGQPRPADVDTLQHLFQNDDHNEGREGNYSGLSNLGSPRLNRLYMERPRDPNFIFLAPFSQFIFAPGDFLHYNTKSPYMNLTYTWSGDKRTGWDRFRAIFATNVGKRFNFGGMFDYQYGQGNYDRQSTSFMNATGFASYTGERYDLHFHYTHNYMKWAENGGLESDVYIVSPEDLPQSYASNEMPVRLTSSQNRLETDEVALNHRYHIGFLRQDSDSVSVWEEFVPVTTLFHSFQLHNGRKSYTDQDNSSHTYYQNDFFPALAQSNDRYRHLEMQNSLGISLREGFNKYAVAGLSAFVGFRYRRFTHPHPNVIDGEVQENDEKHSEHDVLVGGKIQRTQGRLIHYDVNGDVVVAGENVGEFNLFGTGELNIPLLGDTAQVVLEGRMQNLIPSYYLEHYHSKYAWWDTDLASTIRTRLGAKITVPHTRTVISAAVENLKNYAYLADNGTTVTVGGNTYEAHNVLPKQATEHIQVLSLQLRQDLKFGPVHLDNVITWQKSTHEDILPLPALNTYTNLYLRFLVAKVMHCEIGGDMTFFTRYHAPDYSPVVGMFTTQSDSHTIDIGGYPLISVYANVLLKKCRFYVQYYHVNKSEGRYFWAPHYPMNPSGLHFGISWNFYD